MARRCVKIQPWSAGWRDASVCQTNTILHLAIVDVLCLSSEMKNMINIVTVTGRSESGRYALLDICFAPLSNVDIMARRFVVS